MRAASLEALRAVPGLSEVKARYIQDYLSRYPALPDPEPDAVTPAKPQTNPMPDVQADFLKVMGRIILLMASHAEEGLRPRLLRELTRLAERVEEAGAAPPAARKDAERVLRRLSQATELLSDALKSKTLDRKSQAKLADDLAGVTEKLTF